MDLKSKIFISGHTGMLGSSMFRRLKRDGYSSIFTRSHDALDLTQQADVENFFAHERPEYVFHIAAKTGGVMLNKKYPVEYLTEGVQIALNVLDAALKHGTKGTIYVSSANIYPENAPQPMAEELFLSGKMPFFWEGYALSKAVGVKFCESAGREYGSHFISAVLPAVYGSNDFGSTVIPMLVDKFADAVVSGKQQVEIWGTGKAKREFIHADDVVDALLFLMDQGEYGQRYNVGSGEEHTIWELANLLKEISGFRGKLIFDATKPESAFRQFLDSTKLYHLGWRPRISFEDGLREVYKEHLCRMERQEA